MLKQIGEVKYKFVIGSRWKTFWMQNLANPTPNPCVLHVLFACFFFACLKREALNSLNTASTSILKTEIYLV